MIERLKAFARKVYNIHTNQNSKKANINNIVAEEFSKVKKEFSEFANNTNNRKIEVLIKNIQTALENKYNASLHYFKFKREITKDIKAYKQEALNFAKRNGLFQSNGKANLLREDSVENNSDVPSEFSDDEGKVRQPFSSEVFHNKFDYNPMCASKSAPHRIDLMNPVKAGHHFHTKSQIPYISIDTHAIFDDTSENSNYGIESDKKGKTRLVNTVYFGTNPTVEPFIPMIRLSKRKIT